MTRWIARNATTVIVSGAVAAAAALVLAGSPALAGKSAARAATATPVIISGFKPLVIISGAATVATLPLPAGSWAIFAKADTTTQGGGPVELHCQLVAGTSSDHTDPELEAGGTAAFTENIALNVAHAFSAPGSAKLNCDSSGVTVDVVSIKITAIKAGTLKIVKLS